MLCGNKNFSDFFSVPPIVSSGYVSPVSSACKCIVLRFRFDADKKTALTSRMMQRYLLCLHSGGCERAVDPKAFEIERKSTGGKPIWRRNPHDKIPFIHFNVSHDQSVVALAASRQLVGVDCMKIGLKNENRSVTEFFDSLNNQFYPDEWKYIKENEYNDDSDKLERFMELWTMKEAYIKAVGIGLRIEPRRLRVQVDGTPTGAPCLFLDGILLKEAKFLLIKLPVNYVTCICVIPHGAATDAYKKFIPTETLADTTWTANSTLNASNLQMLNWDMKSLIESILPAEDVTAI
eukprot:GHVT01075931.1.p1 GENE.GHVT01075931.1~~GHVT01075931.1.p1  ORF type:complete len:292 (+),score=15.49 GHVT01075931.1:279-1154(+)